MEGVPQNSEFGFLLQQASALKTQQLQQDRRKFESFPTHIQHTLYHILSSQDPTVQSNVERTLLSRSAVTKAEKVEYFQAFKSLATEKFNATEYISAIDGYERALGCFTYLTSTSTDWKTKGIKDENIELHEYFSEDISIRKLKAICLSNIATCYYNMGPQMTKQTIEACDSALALDDTLNKVYFRRARARVLPASSGAVELEAALKDARKAAKLAPKNKEIRKLCSELIEQKAKQKRADAKTFQGLFQRRQLDFREEEQGQGQNVDPNVSQVAMFRELSRVYEKKGKMKEAREIYEAAEKASEAMKEGPQQQTPAIDWDHPTQQMIDDAAGYGLDLNDPLVQAELERLENIQTEATDGSSTAKMMDKQLDTSILVGILVAIVVVCLKLLA